jgi:hypothetical protein
MLAAAAQRASRGVIAGSGAFCYRKDMRRSLLLLAAAALGAPALAGPPEPAKAPEASIPFPHHRGIRSFEAEDDETVYLQASNRRWYRAELTSHCWGLRMANAIGFHTRGSSSFDRFSSIIVEGQRCQLASLVAVDEPPSRTKRRLKKKA